MIILPLIISGLMGMSFQVPSTADHMDLAVRGKFNGTMVTECSFTKATWMRTLIYTKPAKTIRSLAITSQGDYTLNIAGCKQVRIRSTAWTSGSANIGVEVW